MTLNCPHCRFRHQLAAEPRTYRKHGHYVRSSDDDRVTRYRCGKCRKTFSEGTFDPCYGQKKRQLNARIWQDLCSSTSQRRIARNLHIHPRTVARRLLFLASEARLMQRNFHQRFAKAQRVQFDDLETFEHTKCKPLSVTMMLEEGTRRILGCQVSRMPPKGKLVHIARKKYGQRRDERPKARRKLFQEVRPLVTDTVHLTSDSSPLYPQEVKRFFPKGTHATVLGGRSASTGQGELKKLKFDPIFSLNHTFAKFRDDVKRLGRKTWCTTKRPDRLQAHLDLYIFNHNLYLDLL